MTRRPAAIILALALGTTFPASAVAQTADFEGRWRIMDAHLVPDAGQYPIPADPVAPLLRHGVIVHGETVVGTPEISCPQAQVRVDMVDAANVMPTVSDRAIARQIHAFFALPNGPVPTLHIVCGERVHVLHLARSRMEAVFERGGRLYVLRRLGMLPLERSAPVFLPPADPPFGCARRDLPWSLRVVCASPDVFEADQMMRESLALLQPDLDAVHALALTRSQAAFEAFLVRACHTPEEDRVFGGSDCERGYAAMRALFLFESKVQRAGSVTIRPQMTFEHQAPEPGRRGQIRMRYDARPVLVGVPDVVNSAFAAAVRRSPPLPRPEQGMSAFVALRTYDVHSFDGRFLSLEISAGVTQEVAARTRIAVNMDLATGRRVTLEDIFSRNEGWRRAVTDALREASGAEPIGAGDLRRILAGADGVEWLFGREWVTVLWTRRNAAPMGAAIPATKLMPFLKPDSPWRP